MAETTATSEPFSWSKFLSGFNTVVGWAKFASFWLKVAVIAVPLVASVWAYKVVYSKGYASAKEAFYAPRYIAGYEAGLKWADEHPKQIITGSTVNNNVNKVNNKFGMSIFPLRFGWCE